MSARMDRGLAPWSSKQFGARMEHVFLYAPNVAQKKKRDHLGKFGNQQKNLAIILIFRKTFIRWL